jgi:prohibitin 2
MSREETSPVKVFFAALIVFVSLILAIASVKMVPASRVGIVVTFGDVHEETLAEGIHFLNPFSTVREVFLAIDRVDASRAEAASKDLQSVHSDLVVNYRVEPTKAVELFRINTSLDYEERILKPVIYEAFKAVVANYTAEELVSKRAIVSDGVLRAIREKVKPYYINIDNVSLVNFGFSKAFNEAIEQKVTASQQAETAKRKLEQVEYEAQQSIARAKGEAEAIAIQSNAIKENGGAAYLQLRAIEKWDGRLPTYTGGQAIPFIQVEKK